MYYTLSQCWDFFTMKKIFFMQMWLFSTFLSFSTDPNRRGLELCDVWWHHGVRWTILPRHAGLHLLHHPLHLRKLYPAHSRALHKITTQQPNADLKGGLVMMSDHVLHGDTFMEPKRFAGGHWACLLKLLGVQCISHAERLLIIHLSLEDCLQPTTLMIAWFGNFLIFTPLNRYPTECLLGHCCWQSGRCWEPDICPERRGRGEGEEKTGQVKQKKTQRQVDSELSKRPTLEGGEGEWEDQGKALAYSILDSQSCPKPIKDDDTGALKSKD